jgi:ribonuclease R
VSAQAKLLSLCDRQGLPRNHPAAVSEEVARILASPGLDDPALIDLESSAFITIDNEGSRDLDQAMFIAREGRGYRIDYALADAAYYVRPGTALFDDALERGASFYLPGFSVPMLPRELSEDLISLNEDRRRRAFVVRMVLDENADPISTEFFRARIRSRRKLTYFGVQRFYGGDGTLAGFDFTETLELLREIGTKRIRAKEESGVAEYDRLETEIGLTKDQGSFTISARPRNGAEKYNEQVSLLCNMEGARFLRGSAEYVQPIYRVHGSPPAGRIRDLAERIEAVVKDRGLDPNVWRWNSRKETVGDYLRRLPDNSPVSRAIHRQAVVINNPSRFAATAGPHYGIGAEEYSRFSSPMREIVGIFTHKEALEKLAGSGAIDDDLRDRVIEAGNRSKEMQKRLDKEAKLLVIDQVLHGDLEKKKSERPVRPGCVLGSGNHKIYVELDDPPLELKVYREDLGTQVEYSLGDVIRLRVDRYDPARKRWCFDLS